MPSIYLRLAEISGTIAQKDAQIDEYRKTIEQLHVQVAQLKEDLAQAKRGIISEEFKRALGKNLAEPLWYGKTLGLIATLGATALVGYEAFVSPAANAQIV